MNVAESYIPIDRRLALAQGKDLPGSTCGAVLFADISGFTPLTEALVRHAGPKRGAEELTRQLNLVYDALIADVTRYGGSVIGFAGDAITCWFDGDDGGLRATICALAMQQTILQFASIEIPSGEHVSLAMKAAVASGTVRRFIVGDPRIQCMDVLAGETLDRMAAAEKCAQKGEVVLDPTTLAQVAPCVTVAAWREHKEHEASFAVVSDVECKTAVTSWFDTGGSADTPESLSFPSPLSEAQVRPWLLPPVFEGLAYGQEQFLAEIRPAVAMFLSFSGINYDTDKDAGPKLDAYIRWIQNILVRYEGFLLQLIMGDKGSYLYCAFGALLAHDDDASRAVAAALEMQMPHPALGYIQDVRIGISQGQMRTGAYGGKTRRTYGVMGDDVNLAARLMAQAEPGQILVSQRIVNATSHIYQYLSKGSVSVKGKQHPIEVSLVVGRQQPSLKRAFYLSLNPLIGREQELSEMQGSMEKVLAGEGQILRVEGSAGIGKSHLVTEFLMHAIDHGFNILPGSCQSISQGIAYTPWQQIFRVLFAIDDELLDATAISEQVERVEAILNQINPSWVVRLPLLGDLLNLPIPDNETTAAFEPRLRQETLLSLASDLVEYWAGMSPLLLLIEDAHWVDEPSRRLTLALSRIVSRLPIMLMVVHRPPLKEGQVLLPELNQAPNYYGINLNHLGADGVRVLVSQRLKGKPTNLALSLMYAKAFGNPFFTEALIDHLRESGKLYQREDGLWDLSDEVMTRLRQGNCLVKGNGDEPWELAPAAPLTVVALGIPDSVHGAVLSRIDHLPETHKLTLKVASVIGRIFVLNVLARSHPARSSQDVLMDELHDLETRAFTLLRTPVPQPSYMFKHHVIQEVAYDILLEAQQRELHRMVGEALEQLQPDAVEQLAYHYSHSGVREKMLMYLEKAAQKMQRDYANETALDYYQQALALEERWEWRRGQIDVLHILARREDEYAALHAMETIPDVPDDEVGYLWGQYYEAVSDYERALDAINRALAANGSLAAGYLLAARIYYSQGDFETSLQWCQRGLDMARSLGDTAAQAHALMRMGNLRAEEGDFARSIEELEQACTIFEQMHHLAGLSTALNALGATYDDVGRWQDAISCYGRSLEISNTIGDVRLSARASNNMALTLVGRGELQRARELLEHSSEQFRRIGSELEVADFTPNLAEVLLLQGYPQQALPIFHESIEIMERLNARLGLPEVLRLAAEASLEIGDFEQATTYAQDAIRVASEIGIAVKHANARRVLGQIAMSQRDFATARAELEQSRTELEQLGNRYELGKVLYWQARLAAMQEAHDEMLAVARAAYEIFDELGAQHDLKLVAQLIPDLERGSEQGEQARQEVR